MNFQDSLHALRRRLLVVVAAIILGAAGGWFSAPGATAADTTFEATHVLIYESEASSTQNYNIEQVALLATAGPVPSRVAGRVGIGREQVRSAVTAVADSQVKTIAITAQSPDSARAVLLADVTAQELGVEVDGNRQGAYQAETTRLTAEVDSARDRLNRMRGPVERSKGQAELAKAEQALAAHQAAGAPQSQLETLEAAAARTVKPEGIRAPVSKAGRGVLGGIVGLLIGAAGVVVFARLDTRIRSKAAAEAAFGAAVVTEVPPMRKQPEGELLTRTQPSSPFVEAYRGLRTYAALWAPESGPDDGHRVIAVTSPGAGEGKTTTVAHLAAMLAEIGRSVIVISADLRRPRIHQYFDRPGAPGLVDVLSNTPGGPRFEDLDLSTSVRGVRLVASGPALDNPGPLLEQAAELLSVARRMADFVLVDCPPLLVANDAADLARHADCVLLVTRAGRTPVEAAQRSAEMLARLEIPVMGAVLVGSDAAKGGSRYYRDRYYTYSAPKRAGWLRRGSTADDAMPPVNESLPALGDAVASAPEVATQAVDEPQAAVSPTRASDAPTSVGA